MGHGWRRLIVPWMLHPAIRPTSRSVRFKRRSRWEEPLDGEISLAGVVAEREDAATIGDLGELLGDRSQ